MFLNPARFNAFLNRLGQGVWWRRASACPCRSPHSGGANPTCPYCRGTGWGWAAPVPGTVALAGQKINREWAQFGQWEAGDLVVTLPCDSPAYALGEFDRLRFLHSSTPFSLVLTRGREAPLPFAVACLEGARVLQGAELIDVPLPTLADERPDWPGGDGPAAGVAYTLSGRKHPEYFCYGEFPQDRAHHHGRPLPRRVVLRRFDLFGRTR